MNLKHLFLAVAALAVSYTAEAQNNKSFADEHLSLSGYLQGGYSWDSGSNPETTFYLKRARISLTGNAPKEKFDYRLQVDMAGSPKICDLYFRYKPSPAFGMQLGQFKLPFAIENDIYGPTKFEFIDYSYITTFFARNNAEYDGIASTGRDIGFQIYGGFGEADGYNTWSYNLGVFNGAGINGKDHNNSKDIVGRIIYKPSKELSFTASYMYAETDIKVDNGGITRRYVESPRWAIGAIYDNKSVLVRSEYAEAQFGDMHVASFYAMAGYQLTKTWGLYARYEFLNHERESIHSDNLDRITIAGVYKPYDFLRIQINYSYTMSGRDANTTGLNLMVTTIF
ncbi:MAG: porin [Alistipes sp.]|nr:porin [Alistipes sp.]